MPKDLNLLLQPQPDQIRHMRLGTDDAQGLGLRQGDLLLIDTLAEPRFGDIVVVSISGRWKPRRLQRLSGRIILTAQTVTTADAIFETWAQLDVLGVVVFSIHQHGQEARQARRKMTVRPPVSLPHSSRMR
jgi:hypothetical protein